MQKLLDQMIDEHLGFPEEGSAGVRLCFKASPVGYGGALRRHESIKGIYVFLTAIPMPDGSALPMEMMFEGDAVQWVSVAPEAAVLQAAGDPNRTPGGLVVPSA